MFKRKQLMKFFLGTSSLVLRSRVHLSFWPWIPNFSWININEVQEGARQGKTSIDIFRGTGRNSGKSGFMIWDNLHGKTFDHWYQNVQLSIYKTAVTLILRRSSWALGGGGLGLIWVSANSEHSGEKESASIEFFFRWLNYFLGVSAKRRGRPRRVDKQWKLSASHLLIYCCRICNFLELFSEVKSVLFEWLVGFFFNEKRCYCWVSWESTFSRKFQNAR